MWKWLNSQLEKNLYSDSCCGRKWKNTWIPYEHRSKRERWPMGHVSLQFLESESTTKTRDIIFFLNTVPWMELRVHSEVSGCCWSCFFVLPPRNPTISDPTSAIVSLPVSQLRRWLPQLVTIGLTETQTNAWNACFLCLNAISYSQRLPRRITFTLKTICLIK